MTLTRLLLVSFAIGCSLLSHAGAAPDIVPVGSKVELVARTQAAQALRLPRARPIATAISTSPTPATAAFFGSASIGKLLCLCRWRSFASPPGRANGLEFDATGRLLACEGSGSGGRRRVTRTEANGALTVLAEKYEGKRLNSPNDLAVDAKGRIYFTDPRYGNREGLELDKESVYRIDPSGGLVRVIADVERPNGIAVSPDQKTLYVVDNNPSQRGARKVYAYALRPDGSVGARRVLHDFGTGRGGDGMCLDSDGNAYVTAGLNGGFSPEQDSSVKAGVYILSLQGKSLGFIPVPEDSVTNCTFGGPDLNTLYITAGAGLWRIGLNARGVAVTGK